MKEYKTVEIDCTTVYRIHLALNKYAAKGWHITGTIQVDILRCTKPYIFVYLLERENYKVITPIIE